MHLQYKKTHFAASLFVISGFLISTVFNSCSDVKFNSKGEPEPLSAVLPEVDEAVSDNIVKNCEILLQSGQLQTHSEIIHFEDSKIESGRDKVCEFGIGDNLSAKNNYLRAEYTQNRKLNLPANAIICDIQIGTTTQNIKYDDMFYLQFNGYVIASNHKDTIKYLNPEIVNVKNNEVPIYKFDWLKVRDLSFSGNHSDYCLGSEEGVGACSWPKTEQTGTLSLAYDNETLIHLGQRAPASLQQFSLTVTGDDNPESDCHHSAFSFTAIVKYFLN